MNLKARVMEDDLDYIINEHMGFIINTISSLTGRYVSIESDDEFSIGLMAFVEALEKYEEDRGNFLAFAKVVIESRIKNFLNKENKNSNVISIEALNEVGVDIDSIINNPVEDKSELINEIENFKNELSLFNLSLEDLVNEAPKHKDTRDNAINLSKKVSKDKEDTTFIYEKKRLPIKRISLKYKITEKVVKRSKKFILSLVIVFLKKYRNLILWIENRG